MTAPHIYADIPGWFDWEDTYARWVREVPDGGTIVEVGVFCGRSLSFLAVEALNSGKRIALHAVDPWTGSPELMQFASVRDGSFYEAWRQTYGRLHEAGADITEHKRPSVEAAAAFDDASVDRVWLDGDHSTEGLLADLYAWWPKVKPGGELGGHDFGFFGVTPAVMDFAASMGLPIRVLKPHESADRANAAESFLLLKPSPVTSWDVAPENRKVLVCIAHNLPFVPSATVNSLAILMMHARGHADAAGFARCDFHWESGAFMLDDLRDRAIYTAICDGYSHILCLDGDNVWPHDLLARILPLHELGAVSGLYHGKKPTHDPIAYVRAPDSPDPNFHRTLPHIHEEFEPQRVDLFGMGCVLIPLAMCQQMPRPWFKFQRNSKNYNSVTEDIWFCRQMRERGFPMWVDPTLNIGHVSHSVVGVNQYRQFADTVAASHRMYERNRRKKAAADLDRAWLEDRGEWPPTPEQARAAQVARLLTKGAA